MPYIIHYHNYHIFPMKNSRAGQGGSQIAVVQNYSKHVNVLIK